MKTWLISLLECVIISIRPVTYVQTNRDAPGLAFGTTYRSTVVFLYWSLMVFTDRASYNILFGGYPTHSFSLHSASHVRLKRVPVESSLEQLRFQYNESFLFISHWMSSLITNVRPAFAPRQRRRECKNQTSKDGRWWFQNSDILLLNALRIPGNLLRPIFFS